MDRVDVPRTVFVGGADKVGVIPGAVVVAAIGNTVQYCKK